jgi:hypothetical protein
MNQPPTEKEMEEALRILSSDPLGDYTSDEILYWATPYFDVLQAMKEDKKKRIEEESVS